MFDSSSHIKIFALVLCFCTSIFATEFVRPITRPHSGISLGSMAELRDDVYSLDGRFSAEVAFNNRISVYSDISYRFFSYQWETELHDQLHELVDLRVNGFNESYLGVKFFPIEFVGLAVNWRFEPGDGSQNDRFLRLGVEPLTVIPISEYLEFGAALGFYSFIERDNFQPGDEIGGQVSLIWKPFYKLQNPRGLKLSYVFLLRKRIEESKNLNMKTAYQKMDDEYAGFRMRAAIEYDLKSIPLGYGFAYEMNRGTLFGFETGHRIEFFFTSNW